MEHSQIYFVTLSQLIDLLKLKMSRMVKFGGFQTITYSLFDL